MPARGNGSKPVKVDAQRVEPVPGVGAPTVSAPTAPVPTYAASDPDTRVYVGDCRATLRALAEVREQRLDLVFADPPFNWKRDYERDDAVEHHRALGGGEFQTWDDDLPDGEYLGFTREWLDVCWGGLRPGGAMWVNIPDTWAAEIVVHLKGKRDAQFANWCIWHYRFGQNKVGGFINSKVHALYFVKRGPGRVWDPSRILEPSDRASTYFDPRTLSKKDGMPAGQRVPLDVWYGPYWGRIQGNNKERRAGHDNQLPEAYLERVLLCSSREGDLVLDPFLGSGTTGVMARHYGRRFIGCEFSAANAASAWERVTKIGPVGPGKALGQPTAIFAARSAGAKTKKLFGREVESTK